MADAVPSGDSAPKHSFIDIGINLTDPVFNGVYHGKRAHADDMSAVLARAQAVGCRKLMVTGSDVPESRRAVEIARAHPGLCYATVGIHPCSASIFDTHPRGDEGVLQDLEAAVREASTSSAPDAQQQQHIPLAASGEFGLDYDRLSHCSAETQRRAFAAQLALLTDRLYPDATLAPAPPLFLHSRAAHADFLALLRPHLERLPRRGVVHSFTGTREEAEELLEAGFAIGVNGCSLKTEEGLDVVRGIPLGRLMLETDGPWCEVRPSGAGAQMLQGDLSVLEGVKAVKKEKFVEGAMVKGRNEPCNIVLVARVVAAVKGVSVDEVARTCWENTVRMFGFGESLD